MKRFLTFFVCSLLSISLLGCSQPKQDENTITLWHWMTDRDDVLQELAQKYEENTGIKVKVDLYAPSETYSQKIIASAQSKILPDIYGILDKKEVFASFIKSNFVASLTEDFQANKNEWSKSLFEKAVDVNRFAEDNIYGVEPGVYGVPIDVTNIQMLYNKKILLKAGISEPPATFEEFIEISKQLKRVGIPGLVSGWGEAWMIDAFASNYAFNIMGEAKIMDTYQGKVPYTDPDWIKVFKIFETLRDEGVLIEGIVTKSNKYAEQDFALERAAFAYNGSWAVNVYHGMNPDLVYGAMMPPPISNAYPLEIWGGAGSSFVVNKNSTQRDKAVAFLKWLTAKEQQAILAIETKNLPANKDALSSIPEILSDFAEAMDETTHPTRWKYNEHPLVTEEYLKGIKSILIGEKTAEAVAQEVQNMKEREMQKAKKN